MPNLVEMGPEQLRALALEAMRIVTDYYADLADMPVMPVINASALRDRLREKLPDRPTPVADALAIVRDVIYPFCRHNAHPRFFGYVSSPGTPAAMIADLLSGGLNANVTAWRSAPAATEVEHVVIDWLKTMIGYVESSAGLLVSGGSMANFSALAAARTAADPHVGRVGGHERPTLRIYVSDEGHFSIHKAARLLGIGSDNVQSIPTDASLRMDLGALQRRISDDIASGFKPMCIVANAGTVNTGAIDPINDLADIAQQHQLWLHVDAAYGGFAVLAPSARTLFFGIDRADSVTLDPHKWLYTSVGCGCILYRDPQKAMAAFAQHAEYTRPVGLSHDEAFAFWDFGPELSRPFRALGVWLQIKLSGTDALSAEIEDNLACAEYFGNLVQKSVDFELLVPVGLSIFCFRYRPPAYTGDLDSLNERILVELQKAGSSYVSNARVNGKFALRGCVLNYRTTLQDMDRLLEDVRKAARVVLCSL